MTIVQNACPNDDSRSITELVNVALNSADDEVAWDAVCSLHWRGSHEVLERATQLTESDSSAERRLGANILGQLGVPDRSFPDQCKRQLRNMLTVSEDAGVLNSVLIALMHQSDLEGIPLVIPFAKHPDPDVRNAVVHAIAIQNCEMIPNAIETLVALSRDSCEQVRDWATFSIGTLIEIDTTQIRDALAARLQDPDSETRAEALVGLARRKDQRVIAALKSELASDCVGTLAIEAAELIQSRELFGLLLELKEWWDVDTDLLDRAIAASALQN